MTSRTDRFKALPRGAQVGVAVVLVALGVWLFVGMTGAEDDMDASACGRFTALVDDVQSGQVEATSDEVMDRLESVGQAMRDAGGEQGELGSYVTAQAATARAFPAEREQILSDVVERVDDAC